MRRASIRRQRCAGGATLRHVEAGVRERHGDDLRRLRRCLRGMEGEWRRSEGGFRQASNDEHGRGGDEQSVHLELREGGLALNNVASREPRHQMKTN